jgi:hypothetical protein
MQDNRQQTIEFKYTGLDQDSDQRLMNPGDSRYRLNCINDSTDDGLLGDIQNIKGNAIYPYDAPAGTNKVIGSCKDTQNNAIVFFVYNSNGDHQIRRFYPDTLANELILQSEELNFQANFRIYHANIINGLLYWTDGWFEDFEYGSNNKLNYNPPRKINIQKAIDGDPGYSPITFETLDRIKYQPPTTASLRYIYDAANAINYVYGKLYQVTYRYICDDKEVTTWASLSKALLPVYNYKDNNVFELLENTLGITLWTGSEIVTDIEIALRINDSYFIISRLNKAEAGIGSNTLYEYNYNGIGYKENLLAEDFLRPFDYVPQISQTQDIVGGRITDGNVTENYDNLDLDMEFEFIRYDKTTDIRSTSPDIINTADPNTFPWGTGINTMQYPLCTFKSEGVYQPCIIYKDRAKRSGVAQTKEEYILLSPSYNVGLFPLNGMLLDPLKLRYTINHEPPVWAKYYSFGLTKELSYIKKQQILLTARNFNLRDGKIKLPLQTGYTFTEGDKIKLISVMTPQSNAPDDLYTYADQIADYFYLPFSNSNNYTVDQQVSTFNYKVDEYDPATFEIVLTKGDAADMKNYIQGEIVPDPTKVSAFPYYSNYYYLIEIYNNNRDTTENKVFYEVGEDFEIGNAYTPSRYHKCSVQNQVNGGQPAIGEVYGFDAYLRRKKTLLNDQSILLDIFTPAYFVHTSSVDNTIAFPTAWLQAFNNSNLDINGDYSGTALITNTQFLGYVGFGQPEEDLLTNTIIISQISGSWTPLPPANTYPTYISFFGTQEIYPWLEDEAFADDYPSTVYNDGRVNSNLETLGRKNYISRLRWSGPLFENTLTNELSTVFEGSYKDLSETYNEISRIRQVGDTLRVRQKNKMSSFYIDKNMLNVNEGVANVGQSADFLSTPNLYDEYYGSSTPGSDSISTRTTYFMDLLHGLIIRDAGNKPIPISGDDDNPNDQFKMAKFFRDLCKNIRAVGEDSFNIISCWDEFSSLYTLTVQDLRTVFNTIPDQSMTIVFHEPTNRWKSFMSYIPEWYETMGQFLVSFKNAQPYLHYTNPTRNNFFGTQYGQEIRVTANIARNTVKIFNNLDVYSNIAWEIPTINIPSTPNSPNGMLSALPAARFKAKEGVWHASFLRDKNDPKYPIAPLALINGRRLRGETIELVMTNTSTSLVYLRALNIYINPSELTL